MENYKNLCNNVAKVRIELRSAVQYPLSRDEHAALARCLSGIRKQLQDVSDLLAARYGKDTNIAEIAVKTLVSSTLLEHELMLLESETESQFASNRQETPAAAR